MYISFIYLFIYIYTHKQKTLQQENANIRIYNNKKYTDETYRGDIRVQRVN